MIGTLLRIGWLNLKRDRVAQALTFLLPIIFFSIFASVFGNQRDPASRVRVAVVDEDRSDYSTRLVAALRSEGALRVQTTAERDGTGAALTRDTAQALVRDGDAPVAVVLPKGLGAAQRFWSGPDTAGRAPAVQILADVSDPVAPQIVQGMLQKVSFTAMPEALAGEGIAMFERYGGPLTPAQRESVDRWMGEMRGGGAPSERGSGASDAFGLAIEVVNVMQQDEGDGDLIAFYAAGIGVMFLLFSCAGAGGTLLEEEESGTLGRLVSSRAGMSGVLIGKWMFLALMGIVQLTVMFGWGAAVFGVPLLDHLPGFYVMTTVTAAAAAAFGLLLATISRSRAQLSGISTILILTMSALGGSMFPRFLMSDAMQTAGLATFNAWALDGYLKVFWYAQPIQALWPQVLVLASLATGFLLLARLFARRWETL
jgi:ABC-2 type transport system permease protein